MKINPIKQQTLSHKGIVKITTKNLTQKELQTIINNEKLLVEYAKAQKFDYVISKNKKEKFSVNISIVDETSKYHFFKHKETLTTKVDEINSNKMFDAFKFLTRAWENKIPFAELSIKEKLKHVLNIFTQNNI